LTQETEPSQTKHNTKATRNTDIHYRKITN